MSRTDIPGKAGFGAEFAVHILKPSVEVLVKGRQNGKVWPRLR